MTVWLKLAAVAALAGLSVDDLLGLSARDVATILAGRRGHR